MASAESRAPSAGVAKKREAARMRAAGVRAQVAGKRPRFAVGAPIMGQLRQMEDDARAARAEEEEEDTKSMHVLGPHPPVADCLTFNEITKAFPTFRSNAKGETVYGTAVCVGMDDGDLYRVANTEFFDDLKAQGAFDAEKKELTLPVEFLDPTYIKEKEDDIKDMIVAHHREARREMSPFCAVCLEHDSAVECPQCAVWTCEGCVGIDDDKWNKDDWACSICLKKKTADEKYPYLFIDMTV